uniref:Chemokine like factor n=1 Tax=Pelusios castaneus TaxID=367368 RepID=A0A8C8VEW5_9SAUR
MSRHVGTCRGRVCRAGEALGLPLRGDIGLAPFSQGVALVTCICFAASKSHEAFIALASMEVVITLLFFLLYWLKLDKKMKFLFWPLADIFNSLIAVVFFIIVCLCAIIIKTTTGTLVGGVFGLLLVGLCVVDSVLLFRKITFNEPRGRNVTTK